MTATGRTHRSLEALEHAAPANGFGDRWEARVARVPLAAHETGVTHFRLHPGKRSPFAQHLDEPLHLAAHERLAAGQADLLHPMVTNKDPREALDLLKRQSSARSRNS